MQLSTSLRKRTREPSPWTFSVQVSLITIVTFKHVGRDPQMIKDNEKCVQNLLSEDAILEVSPGRSNYRLFYFKKFP